MLCTIANLTTVLCGGRGVDVQATPLGPASGAGVVRATTTVPVTASTEDGPSSSSTDVGAVVGIVVKQLC